MVPVILGVLIALFINNWKDERDDERYLIRVMGSIDKEIQDNINEIDFVLSKQMALIDTLHHYIDDDEIFAIHILKKAKGLQSPTISNTMWQSMLNSKIELLDYEIIAILSEIDEHRQVFNMKLSKIMELDFENTRTNPTYSKNVLKNNIANLIDSEKALLDLQNKYLELRSKK